MEFVAGQTFEEALRKLGERSPVGSILRSAEWRKVPVAIRERSFFSSEVENVRFLQRSQNFLTDFQKQTRETNEAGETYLKAGGRAQFVEELQQFALREGMGSLDPEKKGTLRDIASETRLKLIFDTNLKSSQDFGYWKQGQDPDVLDAFPAQRFIRVATVMKPRDYHQDALGKVRRKDDLQFWISLNHDFNVPWGPWGYNSGCDVEDVGREESDSMGLTSAEEQVISDQLSVISEETPKAGSGIRRADVDFNAHLEASTQGLNQPLMNLLKIAFGDRAQFDGDSVRWQPNE